MSYISVWFLWYRDIRTYYMHHCGCYYIDGDTTYYMFHCDCYDIEVQKFTVQQKKESRKKKLNTTDNS